MDLNAPHLQPRHILVSDLIYAAHSCDVRTVIVDGRVLMRDRVLTTIDLDETIAKAGECAARLFA